MDTTGSGTAEPKISTDGSGTAGSSAGTGSGTAGLSTAGGSGTAGNDPIPPGTAAGAAPTVAGSSAPYRNFHHDDEPVAGSGNSTIFTTARYKNIKTQRQLRGEHTAIGSGPTADC